MYTMAFYLHKGGTGKSSLSILTAQLLGLLDKKVIIVDCDTQGNTTTQLLENKDYLKSKDKEKDKIKKLIPLELADALKGNCYVKDIIKEVRKNLFLLPTRPTAHSSLINYAEKQLPDEFYAFEDLNEELKKLEFDYVIYDMSPASGTLEARILKSVNEVIPVANVGMFSIKGLGGLIQFKDKIEKQTRTSIKWNKVIINKTNNSYKHTKNGLKAIEELNTKIYTIPQDIQIESLQEQNKTIIDSIKSIEEIKNHKTLKGIMPFIQDILKEA